MESSPSLINFNAVEGPRTAEEDDEILDKVWGEFLGLLPGQSYAMTRKSKRNRVFCGLSFQKKNRYKYERK